MVGSKHDGLVSGLILAAALLLAPRSARPADA